VDTSVNSLFDSDSVLNSPVLPQELSARLGRADAPLLLDVRREGKFLESPYLIAGARRCAPEDVAAFAAAQWALNPQREIVVYCVFGHKVSADAVATLRAAGLNASRLAGGMEGGEDGVDAPQEVAEWRANRPLTVTKRADWGVTGEQPSRWITRARPKIDRIACPWLIRRFVDTRAEFFYVPTAQVFDEAIRLNAVAYNIPGAPLSLDGELCSFDALLHAFELKSPALDMLARIVRGADTDRLDIAAQSAGLLAFSLGLSQLHADDHAMLEAAMPLYDALFAWCSSASQAAIQGAPLETHNWVPSTMTGAAK
jgi:rhodanese-related sulfurtransferase